MALNQRKQWLLRKSVELSVVCDLSVFVLIYDGAKGTCTHFQSDPDDNLLTVFNDECHREFFTNNNYH